MYIAYLMFIMKTLKPLYQCDQDTLCCKAGKWNFNTPLECFLQKLLKKKKDSFVCNV